MYGRPEPSAVGRHAASGSPLDGFARWPNVLQLISFYGRTIRARAARADRHFTTPMSGDASTAQRPAARSSDERRVLSACSAAVGRRNGSICPRASPGLASARLTAACDPCPERRDLVARAAPGAGPSPSAEALLAARVGGRRHRRVAEGDPRRAHLKALQAGVPVLVGRCRWPPPSTRQPGCGRQERAAKVPMMVGFNRRWWEPAEALRHHRVASARTTRRRPRQSSSATGSGAEGGPADALHDLAVHHLDLLRYLLDREIATIKRPARTRPGPVLRHDLSRGRIGELPGGVRGAGGGNHHRQDRREAPSHPRRVGPARRRRGRSAGRSTPPMPCGVGSPGGGTAWPRSYERQLRAFVSVVQASRVPIRARSTGSQWCRRSRPLEIRWSTAARRRRSADAGGRRLSPSPARPRSTRPGCPAPPIPPP